MNQVCRMKRRLKRSKKRKDNPLLPFILGALSMAAFNKLFSVEVKCNEQNNMDF